MTTTQTNPFSAIEAAAMTSRNDDQAGKLIAAAKTRLVLSREPRSAFFCVLALRLRTSADRSIDTAATDGARLIYNPDFIVGLKPDQIDGLIAHEVMHCAMSHFARRGARDPMGWNIACDLAINCILEDAKVALPAGALYPGKGMFSSMPRGLSAEDYYARLPKESKAGDGSGAPGSGGQKGSPSKDPGGCGAVIDAGDGADQRAADAEWKMAAEMARAVAAQRGDLPAGLARAVHAATHPTADWRELLRRFVQRVAANDYTWSPPNRRWVHRRVYLPSISSESLGTVYLAVDTSGSIGPATLAAFANEAEAILASYDVKLRILYHDSVVAGEQDWSSTDGPLTLTPVGGGGTDHRPVFDQIEAEGCDLSCLICLTDAETCFPPVAPPYPVLWALTADHPVPFGDRCLIGSAVR